MQHALHERLIDRCWDEFVAVFEQPEVRAAERLIMESVARAFAPRDCGKRRRRPKARPSSSRRTSRRAP